MALWELHLGTSKLYYTHKADKALNIQVFLRCHKSIDSLA